MADPISPCPIQWAQAEQLIQFIWLQASFDALHEPVAERVAQWRRSAIKDAILKQLFSFLDFPWKISLSFAVLARTGTEWLFYALFFDI